METKDLEKQRADITAKIAKIDGMRQNVFAQEQERQKKIEAKNALETKKIRREGELATDTSGITNLLTKKAQIEANFATHKQAIAEIENALTLNQSKLKSKKVELDGLTQSRANILKELEAAKNTDTGVNVEPESGTCPYCEQKLPAEKIAAAKKKIEAAVAEAEKRKQDNITKIYERGLNAKKAIDITNDAISIIENYIKDLQLNLNAEKTAFAAVETESKTRLAEIAELIKSNPKPNPAKDKEWQEIVADIAKLEAEIGEPTGDQITALDNRRTILNNDLSEVNKALAAADRAVQDKARIAELEAKEKQLAQQLADIERQLAMIGDYTQRVSALIESAVNGKFQHVKFKLFETQLNGGIVDACEATFNGVPYSDLSTGQQILVGIDVINTLSNHYGMNVVLFIDHSESMTLPIEANSQTIELYAQGSYVEKTINPSTGKLVEIYHDFSKLTITKKERELANVE